MSPPSGLSTRATKVAGRTNIPKEAESNPHHVKHGDKVVSFKNPHPSYTDPPIWSQVLKPYLTGRLKYPDTKNSGINVVKPQWLSSRFSSDSIRATWLGHASYYIELPSGLRILTDPVFEEVCAPKITSFFAPHRYTKAPCTARDIPIVDAVFISHNHYDHLSWPTVQELKRTHPHAQFFVPRGLKSWFSSGGIDNVTELDWWEDAEFSVTLPNKGGSDADSDSDQTTMTARISCLPAQHNSARTPFNRNKALWCSWAIWSGGKSVWFAGDTGYRRYAEPNDAKTPPEALEPTPIFRQIGEHRGPFDLGLIPIGAYEPRGAFLSMHTDPAGSVEIFRETKCQRAMAIHWGTWVLTFEEVTEPPRLLKEALRAHGIADEGVFDVCDIGESREFAGKQQ